MRDRCTKIKQDGSDLAEYSWMGNAISKRVTTLDYPGGTKPAFKSDFQRDGVGRVTRLANEHLTADMAGSTYGDLGTWDYDYDAGGNLLTATQATTLGVYLRQDTEHVYDTADRLLTTEYTDFQQWGPTNISSTSWYSYDDLGNRISHKYRADSAIGYEHDAANRMTKIAALTQGYDLAGNVTLAYSADRGTSYKYHYDHHNRLTAVYDGATDTTRKAAFAWDALGRRVEYTNDVLDTVTEYWYDGVNEIGEKTTHDPGGFPYYSTRHYIHGVSYVDERLMMHTITRPYYYVIDRMYNVRAILDRAGAIVERYAYDSYGRPLIRESCGRGDMNQDTRMSSTDTTRFNAAKASSIWDPRADLDDDGDVDANDETLYTAKYSDWSGAFPDAEPRQAFSDVGNSFMFQGVPHFAVDTEDDALIDMLSLNHHRARLVDCPTGRWNTRDPDGYHKYRIHISKEIRFNARNAMKPINTRVLRNLYLGLDCNPIRYRDPTGLDCITCGSGYIVPPQRTCVRVRPYIDCLEYEDDFHHEIVTIIEAEHYENIAAIEDAEAACIWGCMGTYPGQDAEVVMARLACEQGCREVAGLAELAELAAVEIALAIELLRHSDARCACRIQNSVCVDHGRCCPPGYE